MRLQIQLKAVLLCVALHSTALAAAAPVKVQQPIDLSAKNAPKIAETVDTISQRFKARIVAFVPSYPINAEGLLRAGAAPDLTDALRQLALACDGDVRNTANQTWWIEPAYSVSTTRAQLVSYVGELAESNRQFLNALNCLPAEAVCRAFQHSGFPLADLSDKDYAKLSAIGTGDDKVLSSLFGSTNPRAGMLSAIAMYFIKVSYHSVPLVSSELDQPVKNRWDIGFSLAQAKAMIDKYALIRPAYESLPAMKFDNKTLTRTVASVVSELQPLVPDVKFSCDPRIAGQTVIVSKGAFTLREFVQAYMSAGLFKLTRLNKRLHIADNSDYASKDKLHHELDRQTMNSWISWGTIMERCTPKAVDMVKPFKIEDFARLRTWRYTDLSPEQATYIRQSLESHGYKLEAHDYDHLVIAARPGLGLYGATPLGNGGGGGQQAALTFEEDALSAPMAQGGPK